MGSLKFKYRFKNNETTFNYVVEIDDKTLGLMDKSSSEEVPEWVNLEYNKCPNCPLNETITPHCPVAKSIDTLCRTVKSDHSFDVYKITVVSPFRIYYSEVDFQTGLKSLFGLIMPTCGCPHTSFLRPLTRFHLPFDDFESVLHRALGNYLIGRLLDPEVDETDVARLEDLKMFYQNISIVNKTMAARIEKYKENYEPDKNALVILDSFTQLMEIEWETNFESISYLYKKQA